ncbi:MAG TPA: beta-ketoacyl-ACP synthase III [Acidimicrobiales bacterium]|jgi:3-oxoacyl-[acyl-carrier-protein] synthase-3|nr:beta-ketoacyl-ACP synthase III [Acidimicrobiales bacterium]
MTGVTITGWGTSLPDRIVTNKDITTLFDTTEEWIAERSGIRSRRAATGPFVDPQPPAHPPESGLGTTGTLAVEAGRQAMACAGVEANDIDLVVLCTTTPDQLIPANSASVAAALGIAGGSMDLNAACAGFTYGLVTASGLLAIGAERILLIGAETLTRATNWEDRTNAFLFGDGAGAVIVEATPGDGSLLGWDLGVDGTLVPLLYAQHGSGMVMRGKEVFRRAVLATVESARTSLERAKLTIDDIDLFVPHQANIRIMEAAASRLGLSAAKIASVIDRTGNTSSASIPLALIDAVENGRVHDGDHLLLAGFGAGMTWASAVWRWQGPSPK